MEDRSSPIDYEEPPLPEWAPWLGAVRGLEQVTLIDWPVVVARTESTQDIARRLAGRRGAVLVVAGRQTAGRGRLGRAWADTRDAGLAMSFALTMPAGERQRISLLAAVAVADAVEHALASPGNPYDLSRCEIAIRWPNDIVTCAVEHGSHLARKADQRARDAGLRPNAPRAPLPGSLSRSRKLAGILVECVDDLAVVGIGINVAQLGHDWPEELRDTAASLRQLGSDWSRLDVADRVMVALDRWLRAPAADALRAFASRDCLAGTRRRFLYDGRRYEGVVEGIDPLGDIRLRADGGGPVTLPAAATSLLHD